MSALNRLLRTQRRTGPRRHGGLRRSAPIWLGLIITVGSAIPPATGEVVPWLPTLPKIPIAYAGYPCSSHSGEFPMFSGHLSNSSGTMLAESTTGDVYGRVSNVDQRWQPSPGCGYYRYDAVIWATDNSTTELTVHWGALSGDMQPCNYVVGTADYIHANAGACPSASTAKHIAAIGHEAEYQNDVDLNNDGDFAFAHSDCIDWYQKDKKIQSVSTAVTSGEPGANCGYKQLDGTNTTQTLVVDGTAPAISFVWPPAGGPIVIPAAFVEVKFNATDAVAGFGGTDDWDLQRQSATWNGSNCVAPFSNDGAPVSGYTSGTNQISSQSLDVGKCYQWTLAARDENGNTASTITSGSIRTDTSGVLGLQAHLKLESWELGAGDTLRVSPGSGNVMISHPIVELPIRGSSTSINLTYNSHDSATVGFGPGWRLNVQRRLAIDTGTGKVTFTDADGSRHTFTSPVTVGTVTTYTRPSTLYATLVKDTSVGANEFVLTYRDKSKDKFDILGTEGILVRAEDRFSNGVTVAYFAATNRITTITDTAASPNRTINFAYDGSNRLTSITDWAYWDPAAQAMTQTGSAARRATRFFYDGSSNLIGWADGLDTTSSCPTGGSHLTCLTLTSGLVTAIGKTQTVETISGSPLALGSTTRTISTQIVYAAKDVTAVKDAEQVFAGTSGTTFTHPGAGQTKVVRLGTPSSETTYTRASVTDSLGRITSVKRKFGGSQIEQLTTYDATYPTEPASITENNGALLSTPARTTTSTYVGSSLGLVSVVTEPLTASVSRTTTHSYNSNNDLTQIVVAPSPSDPLQPPVTTRYCYDAGCNINPGSPTLTMSKQIDNYVNGTAGDGAANVEDVTTTFTYDTACAGGLTCGQLIRSTRANFSAAGTPLDSRAIGYTYDDKGNRTADILNFVDGAVSGSGDDVTPNATNNARTDLTTAYTYDTAGNLISSADPRRAIEVALGTSLGADDYISRSAFDPLGKHLRRVLPTTPAIRGGVACSPDPGCRTTTSVFDELGGTRQTTDPGGVVGGTEFDRLNHATRAFEDTDGAGSTPSAVIASATYDAAGRVATMKDRRQVADPNIGCTRHAYDELGRATDVIDGSGTAPCSNTTGVSSTTHTLFDALSRPTCVETAWAGSGTCIASDAGQWSKTTYDLGGRAIAVDDEFTCTTTAYDYRDLVTQTVQGLATSTCAGGTPVTTTITNDALNRTTLRLVDANNAPESNTYDAAGNILVTSGKQGGVTTTSTYTVNPLDQAIVETRTDGSTAKSNYDPAGNATDRCYWKPSITVGLCLPADTASWTNPPTQAGTTKYDARNKRIELKTRLGSTSTVSTTTYDASHDQVSGFYLPTASGKEYQTVYRYDARHRLGAPNPPDPAITHVLCATNERPCSPGNILTSMGSSAYTYDDNDNRTTVTESSAGGAATTRNYCYDLLNRLRAEKTAAACTTTSGDETYNYDDAGNRLTATVLGSTRTFTYNSTDGQLDSCSSPTCTITYYDDGRTKLLTDNGVSWFFVYDADGKLISACKSTSCSGSIDRVDYLYDGSGHRTQIKESDWNGTTTIVTTTDLRYQGDNVVQELVGGTVSRTYASDDTGRIVQVCDADCATGTIYVVVYNGHGDATGLWRQNADGTLTLANSYTYSTWGTPTTTVAGGFTDLRFRFLYVGAFDVQWDSSFGLNVHYMHARHYSPALGRFLQPDPSAAEANLYAYASNNPVTMIDPSGRWGIVAVRAIIELIKKVGPAVLGWLSRTYVLIRFGPFGLTVGAVIHIVQRHASNVQLVNFGHSKFTNDAKILDWIAAALDRGRMVMQGDRGVATLTFAENIGINGAGQKLKTIRVVVEQCGWFWCSPTIITAYPIATP